MTGPAGPSRPGSAPADPALVLSVRHLSVAVGRQPPVVHDVSFNLPAGRRLGLIGESGSGKSLTALAILGLLPDAAQARGSVRLHGRELLGLKESQLAAIRGRQLGMVFQEPMTALDPTMKVGRQVAEVVRLHARYPKAYQLPTRERVLRVLRSVQLDDPQRIAGSYPHQLSGGQRQRVALALALVNGPDLLVCDEPTTALDVTVQARVLATLDSALRLASAACLFISHDLAVVAQVCTDVLVLLDGRVVDSGPVAQVLGDPQHPYTAGLVATARLDAIEPGTRLPTLADFYPAPAAQP